MIKVIFENDFEKKLDSGETLTAHVEVNTHEGHYDVIWQEANKPVEDWYSGDNVDVMLKSFRRKISEKCAEGFIPHIDLDEVPGL